MEREISERYHFNPADFGEDGRRVSDGLSFRDVVKDFERDFHNRMLLKLKKITDAVSLLDYDLHYAQSPEYALNMYANEQTMKLLAKSNNAEPFMNYGMRLSRGHVFNRQNEPVLNKNNDEYSDGVLVYGIDSAFLDDFDEYGYPVIDVERGIYPLTLLIDSTMADGEIRLATPTFDDGVMIYDVAQILDVEPRPEDMRADLVHTSNGEWVYDRKTFRVPESLAVKLEKLAERQGQALKFHKAPTDFAWCYKREIKNVELRMFPLTIGELEVLWSILSQKMLQ